MSRIPKSPVLLPAVALVLALVIGVRAAATPGFLLGAAASLALVFGLIWSCGIRYPDVGWMLVTAALVSLEAGLALADPRAVLATRTASALAYGALLISFYRLPASRGRLGLVYAVAVAAVAAAAWWAPLAHVERYVTSLPSYLAAVVLALFVPYGLWTLGPLPAKRRRYVGAVVATSAVFAGLFALRARGAALPGVDHGLVAAFALFLLADLVVFHRIYFKEKASRVAEQQQRSVRALFLPAEREGRHGPFRFEFHFEPAARAGGDWMFHWDDPVRDEHRLLFGHMIGRGQDGALGVAVVVSCLREAKTRAMDPGATAAFLNARLLELFGGQMTTTLMAVSAAGDGTVELFNAGGAGFFAVSRDGLRRYALPSSPLGAARELEAQGCPIPLADGDVLFAATAGLLASEGIGRLEERFEEDLDVVLDPQQIKGRVMELGGGADGEDRTLLLVTKLAA